MPIDDGTDQLLSAAIRVCELAVEAARPLLAAGTETIPELLLVVMEALSRAALDASTAMGSVLRLQAAPSREQAPAAKHVDHRHKFGADGRCTVAGCAKVKSAAGRKPAAEAPPPVDTNTAPLPGFAPGAADRFAGGGQGSSSTNERRR